MDRQQATCVPLVLDLGMLMLRRVFLRKRCFFQNNRTSRVELLMFHQKFLKKYLFSNFKILGNCYRSDSERGTLFFVENFLQSTPDVKYKGLGLRSVLPPGM